MNSSNPTLPSAPPATSKSKVPAVGGKPPHPFFHGREPFAGIDKWPDVDQAFRKRASELHGQSEWELRKAGVVKSPDGQPTLGEYSCDGLQILTAAIDGGRCFRFVDAAGTPWAAIVAEDRPDYLDCWMATAIGVNFGIGLLNRPTRLAFRDLVFRRLSELDQPGQPSTPANCWIRSELWRVRRWLATLDDALALATELFEDAYYSRPTVQTNAFQLANSVWGSNDHIWPRPWRMRMFDAFGLLSGIEVQTLRLPKTGWRPHPLTRRPAVSVVTWSDDEKETLKVCFAPGFVRFLSHWLWINEVDNNDPAATYMGDLPRIITKVPFDADA